jgi:hypothetical protein
MRHYENLATLAMRWMAVGFFILAFISVALAGTMGVGSMMGVGGMGAGSMMGPGEGGMSGHMGTMTQGSAWMWWAGPTLVPVIIGLLLYAMSRPIGRVMASGLE